MVTLIAVDSHVTEIPEVAHKILHRNRDHELAQTILILQGYVELSRRNPDRSYDENIRKALDDLTAHVHSRRKTIEKPEINNVNCWKALLVLAWAAIALPFVLLAIR